MKFGIFGLATLTLAVTGCQPEVAPPPVAAVVKAAPVLAPPAEPPPEPVFEEPRPLQLLAAELQAPGAELETSCEAPPCAHPLAAFFDALEKNAPLSPDSQTVRIVVLGNSLIATDGVVSMVRERLIERLGSAGRGQLLADRLGSWGPRIRTGTAAGKWGLSTVGILKPLKQPHGLSGAQHQALSKNASTTVTSASEANSVNQRSKSSHASSGLAPKPASTSRLVTAASVQCSASPGSAPSSSKLGLRSAIRAAPPCRRSEA